MHIPAFKNPCPAFLRGCCCAIALAAIFCLFWLGEKPAAVSLLSLNPPFDRLEHIVVFGVLAALLRLSTTSESSYFVLVVMIVVGAADEIHQLYLPGRVADLVDFAADLVGIVVGLTILLMVYHRKALHAP